MELILTVLRGVFLFVLMNCSSCLCFAQKGNSSMFSMLSPSITGINFKNSVNDTRTANIMIYESFYEGGGVGIGDFNNDGLQDIYFCGNQVEDKLYLNQGDFHFKDITEQCGIISKGAWSTGVNIVDINNDGYQDIYVCKSLYDDRPDLRINELYINNGDLTFTESASLYQINDPWRSMHANFFDYDKDGDFDLFLINQPPNPSILSPLTDQNYLDVKLTYRFLENKNGVFQEVTKKTGLENIGYGLSSVATDFNNDGWIDLYVANDYEGPDFLYINNGDGTFTNKIDEYLKHLSFFSMGADSGDINNDGLMDLVVVDMVAEDNFRIKSNMSGMNPKQFWQVVQLGGHYQYMYNTLQLNRGSNNGDYLFSEIGQLLGVSNTDWSWAPLFIDMDNNGFKDLFVTNGIKRDVRNTDALENMRTYVNKKITLFKKKNPNVGDISIWELVDLDKLLEFFPKQKLNNYVFKNDGELNFKNQIDEWGIDQASFSSGAAYGDLDNDGDMDLVVNNVDDIAFVYKNNSEKLSKNKYLKIRFLNEGKNQSFFGTRVTIYYDGKQQVGELTSSRGFYSTSEASIHFGMGKTKRIDSLIVSWYDGGQTRLKRIKVNQTLNIDRATVDVSKNIRLEKSKTSLFSDVTENLKLNHSHRENNFNDYKREVLLPHKMSVLGPCLAVGDVNNDGEEDFFIGGSIGSVGSFFSQNKLGEFQQLGSSSFKDSASYEDMGAVLFDADLDGDLDLYISSGGNEYSIGNRLYQDRFFINNGAGVYSKNTKVLPVLTTSSGIVIQADYDYDGDIDLFVCGRQVPGKYPEPAESYLLKNNFKESGSLLFEKIINKDFESLGMVTDAKWTDFDNDKDLDLILVGEWMPITIFENNKGSFQKKNLPLELQKSTGWWYSISASDLDNDGDDDYIIGNLGLNYKYKASEKEPFTVNYGDFDRNGTYDIVLGYYNYGEHYPLRGKSCSILQIPKLKNRYSSYNEFAKAKLVDVYSTQLLNRSLEYKATMFQSICLENLGNGKFNLIELPRLSQLSSINGIIIDDVDQDGNKDVIIAGNMYGSEIETPRNDSSVGLFMKGNGDCTFQPIPMQESGLSLPYDVKELKSIRIKNKRHFLVGVNNGPIRIIQYK